MEPQYSRQLPPLISWIIILLALSIAILWVWYAFSQLNATLSNWPMISSNRTNEKEADAQPAPSPAANTPSGENIDNWINYTNNAYGFTLKYPNGWKLQEKKTNNITEIDISTKGTVSSARPAYTIYITTDSLDQVIKNEVDKFRSANNFQQNNITYAGLDATQLSFNFTDDNGKTWGEKVIIFGRNKQSFVISGIISDPVKADGINLGIFELISSTFQFIQ